MVGAYPQITFIRVWNISKLITRYVHDANLAVQEIPLGARYENGKLVIKQGETKGNMLIPAVKRTMEIVKDIGSIGRS